MREMEKWSQASKRAINLFFRLMGSILWKERKKVQNKTWFPCFWNVKEIFLQTKVRILSQFISVLYLTNCIFLTCPKIFKGKIFPRKKKIFLKQTRERTSKVVVYLFLPSCWLFATYVGFVAVAVAAAIVVVVVPVVVLEVVAVTAADDDTS